MTGRKQRFSKSSADIRAGLQLRRSGISLMEVLIATAMLMGSAVVLSRLAGMGRDQAWKAATRSELQELCEQTMQEILLGQRPAEMVEDAVWQPLSPPPTIEVAEASASAADSTSAELTEETETGDPRWRYSVRTSQLSAQPGMWVLTVETVEGDQSLARRQRFALTRWIAGEPPAEAFVELDLRSAEEFPGGDFLFGDQP